ncbi:MAG: hypothetical protein GVY13_09710 [Alphaproteobacteria bacterium]|jgi:NADPH-dependent ferric siderophore reductase|nr:hypothetical protein [Alphaproteobacteria bacterium]
MRAAILAILAASAATVLPTAGPLFAQSEGAWQSSGGRAEISNGGGTFTVACVDDAAGRPALVMSLEPEPAGEALPAADTLLLQVSSRADAYVIAAGTDISTWFLPVTAAPDGRLVSAAAPLDPVPAGDAGQTHQVREIIADLQAGMNLVVGGGGFARAERFTLRGSRRAIDAVAAACRAQR